jgi:hypothetical protein
MLIVCLQAYYWILTEIIKEYDDYTPERISWGVILLVESIY